MPPPKPGQLKQDDKAFDAKTFARRVLDAEAEAVRRIEIDDQFSQAVGLVESAAEAGGNVVISGLGKSGLIAQKLSATFASTGTPSLFLHPVEALHGDLGRVRRGDVLMLLSFGGNTEEVVTLAELVRQDGVSIIAMVGKPGSSLERAATVTLSVGDITEACPLELAPTSSTTAMLALGDALALAVSKARSFTADDFQRFHPGGGLGRQLMPIVEAMRFHVDKNLPLISLDATVQGAYQVAEAAAQESGLRRPGALMIVDDKG
jgi:arabinose-5-phosphate isomerase